MSDDNILNWENKSPTWDKEAISISNGGINIKLNWINVKVKLPEHTQVVLVVNEQGEMAVCECKIYEDNWQYIFMLLHTSLQITKVTHWMDLPSPPKEETPNE